MDKYCFNKELICSAMGLFVVVEVIKSGVDVVWGNVVVLFGVVVVASVGIVVYIGRLVVIRL